MASGDSELVEVVSRIVLLVQVVGGSTHPASYSAQRTAHLLLIVRIADTLCTNCSLEVNVSVGVVTSDSPSPEPHAERFNRGLEVVIEVVIEFVIATC